MDFAERLSLWLNAFDAINLQAAHRTIASTAATSVTSLAGKIPRPGALAEDLRRVRATLAKAIAQDPAGIAPAASPIRLPTPPGASAALVEAIRAASPEADSYAPWQQRHLELQRRMEQLITPLRDHVRQAVAQGSARLRQLATLDAAMEQVLARREQALLPGVAELLQRRFEQLRAAHRQAVADAGEPDDAACWRQPGGWLDTFAKEWRQALLAELDLRLEPVAGLVDALESAAPERKHQQ